MARLTLELFGHEIHVEYSRIRPPEPVTHDLTSNHSGDFSIGFVAPTTLEVVRGNPHAPGSRREDGDQSRT